MASATSWGLASSVWARAVSTPTTTWGVSVSKWRRSLARVPYVTEALADAEGPIVANTDFMKAVPDQVSRWVPRTYVSLGTDGYGRSDTRQKLRRHFETDTAHVVLAVLTALAKTDDAKPQEVADAIARYGIDPEATNPREA